jgi:hypothetical protein
MTDEVRELRASINAALDRMKRAHERGTGCHLTADMIQSLSVSVVGHLWDQDKDQPHDA